MDFNKIFEHVLDTDIHVSTEDREKWNTMAAGIGEKGDKGDTWKPSVNENGDLSWAIDSTTTTPSTVNIKGSKGDSATREEYTHTQSTASTEWIIQHNLGIQYPNVLVLDTDNNEIIGSINYYSANLLKINFDVNVAGKAIISN